MSFCILCNFVSNFLVVREKLHGKLQARAIIPTRGCWIFIVWIFYCAQLSCPVFALLSLREDVARSLYR